MRRRESYRLPPRFVKFGRHIRPTRTQQHAILRNAKSSIQTVNRMYMHRTPDLRMSYKALGHFVSLTTNTEQHLRSNYSLTDYERRRRTEDPEKSDHQSIPESSLDV